MSEEFDKLFPSLIGLLQDFKYQTEGGMLCNLGSGFLPRHIRENTIDKNRLNKAISMVNAKLYDDPHGSYQWNEMLLEELGLEK